MKIVIFGCGKIGTSIIESLVGEGHDIVVVDKDPGVVEEVSNIYDVMGLCGSGVDSDIMSEAGVADAELFIAVTGSDELNMLGCFLAGKMGARYTVARIRNPEYNDESLGFIKQHLDLSVALNPERLVAQEIMNILHFPTAAKVESFSGRNLQIVNVFLKDDSLMVGMKLSELRKKYREKFLICNVVRGDEVYVPNGDFIMKPGDRIGITAARGDMLKLLRDIGMPQKQPKNVIILGASRIAYYLAKLLIAAGIEVTIIDRDKQRCEEFALAIPEAVLIHGDGMKQEVLREEGIAATDAYIALTGTDEENVLSAFYAGSQKVPVVIAKINRQEMVLTAEKLGISCIVSPLNIVSDIISRYARALHNSIGSNVETLYKLMDGKAEILEFKVFDDFPYCKIPLKELNLKKSILLVGIVRGRRPILPTGEEMILPGDRVIVQSAGQPLGDLADIVG
ncbi:MAG: Trk system potassium transporter TrkA [Ruminococcaceae bacterium]|nr:Trk system potassium transporter TrkA [Oscillospiraceae bacterium]